MEFEEYLSEQFWKQYNGLDDEASDAEADWITDLSPDEWCSLVNKYAEEIKDEIFHKIVKYVKGK